MHDEIYVDGVLAAVFKRGMLRIDLFTLAPESRPEMPGRGGEEEKQLRQRLLMTPQGFAEAYGVFTEIMLKLKQSGLIQAAGLPSEPSPGSAGSAARGTSSPEQEAQAFSPNF